ncbi:hypothetical protein [Frigoribacterium sp. CFBP 13707]|uniref:hypothetical protein n=1 Tax=Frigoribacterium sp. CFBP 13707 TaxID=2775313 RepID=UPI001785AFB8|nr:hypothetical protein [Frigoribacterium sp. CFBP 13707]MBD8728255.1 hypothetical protein [Frigoribacterium sp. CFBP 13707]
MLLLALGLLVLAVSADRDVPLTLTAAETDIPWCSTDAPVIVADLSTDALPTCAPHGVEMRFPDGAVIDLPDEPGTGARSVGVHDYTYVDVGAFAATRVVQVVRLCAPAGYDIQSRGVHVCSTASLAGAVMVVVSLLVLAALLGYRQGVCRSF